MKALMPLHVCQAACALMMDKFGLLSTCVSSYDVAKDQIYFRLFLSGNISVNFKLEAVEMKNSMAWVGEQIFAALQQAAFEFWGSDDVGGPIPKIPTGQGFSCAEMR